MLLIWGKEESKLMERSHIELLQAEGTLATGFMKCDEQQNIEETRKRVMLLGLLTWC